MRLTDNDTIVEWAELIQNNLEPHAIARCAAAITQHQQPDGGFAGRSTSSDIYYTFFAMASLTLLGKPIKNPGVRSYLKRLGDGTSLDLVHGCCLLRCRDLNHLAQAPDFLQKKMATSALAERLSHAGQRPLKEHIRQGLLASKRLYDWFLGLSALGTEPDPDQTRELLDKNTCLNGGYGSKQSTYGTTPITAAGLILGHASGLTTDTTVAWLLDQKSKGSGFRANPSAPLPDLLSTATAINALAFVGYDLSRIATDTLEFVESCWGPDGQFFAAPGEPTEDPEYTFYGLLTLIQLMA